MPLVSASRSSGPAPAVRITAGLGVVAATAGLDTVPASVKPIAGMRTCSSFGREMAMCRDETDATSVLATSRPCAGAVNSSSRPFSSPQIVKSRVVPGELAVTRVFLAVMSRVAVWICSVVESPTRSTTEPIGRIYAGKVDPAAAFFNWAATASYGL